MREELTCFYTCGTQVLKQSFDTQFSKTVMTVPPLKLTPKMHQRSKFPFKTLRRVVFLFISTKFSRFNLKRNLFNLCVRRSIFNFFLKKSGQIWPILFPEVWWHLGRHYFLNPLENIFLHSFLHLFKPFRKKNCSTGLETGCKPVLLSIAFSIYKQSLVKSL